MAAKNSSRAEFELILRNDFYSFMLRCYQHLYPKTKFVPVGTCRWWRRHSRLAAAATCAGRSSTFHRATENRPRLRLHSSPGILVTIPKRKSFASATHKILPKSLRATA